VYTSADRHNAVLSTELPHLLRSMGRHAEGWFFIRYRDPEPHLRLRFRGRQSAPSETLGILHDWFAGLLAKGITARLTLDTYDPEIERYGGGDAAAAAERLFQADSEACQVQLDLLHRRILPLDRVVLAAANYVDIIHRMLGCEHARAWMRTNSDGTLWAQVPQSVKDQARRVIEPGNDWQWLRSMPGGAEVVATWQRRGDTIAPFVAALTSPADVLPSILHMHHNRLIGIDTESEKQSLSLLYAGGSRHGR
jgi:thiopeptide-type bacteriocin biosynthesis protein